MNPLPSAAAWTGHYRLHPGHAPAISGQRPILAPGQLARLLQGQTTDQAVQSVGQLFAMCAHAHQACARWAIDAAMRDAAAPSAQGDDTVLCLDTARDHLRCMALDWPQRLAAAGTAQPPDLHWLRGCPLSLSTPKAGQHPHAAQESLQALTQWLHTAVLLEPLADWLSRCHEPATLLQWCEVHALRLAPARALAGAQPLLALPTLPIRVLHPIDATAMRALAQSMLHTPGFCERPTWSGLCAETGAWARWRDQTVRQPAPTAAAWTRLSSRWEELVKIAQEAHARVQVGMHQPMLALGTLVLDKRQAMAWCEMARGLLVHVVSLDARGRVDDYRVLAPTEWNFHPDNSLGQAVRSLPEGDCGHARLLGAAFDPCVACEV